MSSNLGLSDVFLKIRLGYGFWGSALVTLRQRVHVITMTSLMMSAFIVFTVKSVFFAFPTVFFGSKSLSLAYPQVMVMGGGVKVAF